MISGKAILAGVLGWPVKHSLSPTLHNHWLRQLGIDGAYVPMAVDPANLESVLRALPRMGFAGCNLTIPHKERAFEIVDTRSEIAERIGAVNTIIIQKDGSLHGTNTDAQGFMNNIIKKAPTLNKKKVVVLGAGGAALAVCAALQDAGFEEIVIINRTYEKAEIVARKFGAALRAAQWEAGEAEMEQASLLVNTTSLGMDGQEPLMLPLSHLPLDAVVNDIVYAPLMTDLLKQAKAKGNPIVTGIGMLIEQAVPGFEAWFGKPPPVTASEEALLLKQLRQ